VRTLVHAFGSGFRRAGRAWRLVLLLWVVNLAVALPLAAVVAQELRGSLDRSRVHQDLLAGFDAGWHGELQAEAGALVKTFGPELLGADAFFENLERWWRGDLFSVPPALVAAGLLYAAVWAFLLGGVLERLVRPGGAAGAGAGTVGPGDRAGAAGFFAACGRHAFRFLRLALLAAVFYWLIYRVARAGFGALEDAARDVTSERTVLLWVLAGAAVVALLLALVRVVFDYAKIAVVADGRRSALGAAWAGARYVASRPFATLGLYGAFALAGAVLLALYALLPPFTGVATWPTVILAFLVAQLALAAKLALRLALLGAEASLFSGR
jgi:hypothetical protein